jgi:hypothetical protein
MPTPNPRHTNAPKCTLRFVSAWGQWFLPFCIENPEFSLRVLS